MGKLAALIILSASVLAAQYTPPSGGGSSAGTGARVLVASTLTGIHQNTSLATGGGTDDTTVLQTALNSASTGTPVELIVDGPSLVTGLTLYSNTTVHCVNGGGFFLAASSNKPVLANVHRSKTTRTDTNIAIDGCYANGNGGNQAMSQQEADGTIIVGIGIFGATNVSIRNVTVYDSSAWAYMYSNVSGGTMDNCTHLIVPGSMRLQQDGFDARGPADHIALKNFRTQSYDDAVALNTIAYLTSVVGPQVGGGDITDVTVDGLILDNALFGVDLVSSNSTVTRVTIQNVTGTVAEYVYHELAGGNNASTAETGAGHTGEVLIDGINVAWTSGTATYYSSRMPIETPTDSLTLRNIKTYGGFSYLGYLRILASVKQLSISGFDFFDSAGYSQGLIVFDAGANVSRMLLSGVNYVRSSGTVNNNLIHLYDATAVLGNLSLSNITTFGLGDLIFQERGAVTSVDISEARMDTASGAVLDISAGTTAPTLTIAASTYATLTSGANAGAVTVTATPVTLGGTGKLSYTTYALLAGGTTATGTLQQIASVGTAGQLLTSNGAGALPTFQTSGAGANPVNYYTSSGFTGLGPTSFTPASTLNLLDATASTGATNFIVGYDNSGTTTGAHTSATTTQFSLRAGQSQGSTRVFELVDAGRTTSYLAATTSAVLVGVGMQNLQSGIWSVPTNGKIAVNGSSTGMYCFANGDATVTAANACLAMNAVGTAEINTGTLHTLAPIKLSDITVSNQPATTGQRFACLDTNGKIVSSATACVGT